MRRRRTCPSRWRWPRALESVSWQHPSETDVAETERETRSAALRSRLLLGRRVEEEPRQTRGEERTTRDERDRRDAGEALGRVALIDGALLNPLGVRVALARLRHETGDGADTDQRDADAADDDRQHAPRCLLGRGLFARRQLRVLLRWRVVRPVLIRLP